MNKRDVGCFLAVIIAMLANSGCSQVPVGPPAVSITPMSMQRIASIDKVQREPIWDRILWSPFETFLLAESSERESLL